MAWQMKAQYAGIPNNVLALYATFRHKWIPFLTIERKIEAWGQLCFDSAAANAVAYNMYNKGWHRNWIYVSWRCEMEGELVGGAKTSGKSPTNFDVFNYVPRRYQ